MEIDVPTTEPVVLESGVENTLIPSEEGDFLITITSDRGVPVVKLPQGPLVSLPLARKRGCT